MNLCHLLALAVAGAFGVSQWGYTAESLRLDEAITRALEAHPALAAESANLHAVLARAQRDEGLPTPYVVGADLDNFGGTGVLAGIRSAETTLRIGRVVELGGKRTARQALGSTEIALQHNQFETTRLDVISRTTNRFMAVLADQQRLHCANEQVMQSKRTRHEVSAWVTAARNPESDLRAAEIAVSEAELELMRMQYKLPASRQALAANWGQEPDFDQAKL